MIIEKSIGLTAAILVGLLVCILIFKYANTNHRIKTEYDERQQEIRGKGYKAAFFAAMIMEVLMMILFFGGIPNYFEPYMAHAAVIFLSCTVLCCYLVWNGAYWGLNNNHKRYYIILAATFILNAIPVIMTCKQGEILTNGKFSSVFINFLALIMLIVIGIVMAVRDLLDHKAEKE